jgi:hypothetical protein
MNLELLAEAFNLRNRTHVFGVGTSLYSRGSGVGSCASINGNTGGQAGFVNLCRRTDFNIEPTITDSTLYRERQIQFAARFQF